MHHILAKHTNQDIKKIADDFERDRWMNAETAKEYGLVDEIMGSSIFEIFNKEKEAKDEPKDEPKDES